MSLRIYSHTGFTPTGTADTTNLADATHMTIQGGSTTQRVRWEEVYLGGQAGASSVNACVVARNSTVGATLSNGAGGMDAIADASGVALATTATAYNTATTKPQRSSTLHLLNLSFNSFGGIVRWVTSPNLVGPVSLGNAASLGELSLNAMNIGTAGQMGAHIVYEPY